jgi:signal transduction histidine kinase
MDVWRADPIRPLDRPETGEGVDVGPAGLSLRLSALRRALERSHPVSVAIDIADRDAADGLPPALTTDLHALLQEAAVNAACHSGAALVRLGVHLTANSVLLRIEDDGAGFAFQGVYDLDALAAFGVGPQRLARRVAMLGGTMNLDTRRSGTRIEITLPRERSATSESEIEAPLPLLAAG